MSERTLKLTFPRNMTGDDVRAWQQTLLDQMHQWGWRRIPLKADGVYGIQTRAYSSLVLKGLGIAQDEMKDGITPELRIKVRNKQLSREERSRAAWRAPWRTKMRRKFRLRRVRSPIQPSDIVADSWGWHPPIHDGIDLICAEGTPLRAICKARVVRADASGWWGAGAPRDPNLKARGDGIIIIRSLVNAGPIKESMNLCYGHAEHAAVKEGDVVQPGQFIGRAGMANAGHVHFMVNDNPDTRGVGDRNPERIYRYARRRR